MGVIVLEGLVVTLLVVVGFREAVMNAVPLALKRAIGAGIGLFILFIGFVNGGFIATPAGGAPIVGPVFPTTTAQFLFLAGLLFTIVLWVLKVRGALIISILVITIVALIVGVASVPKEFSATPSFATLGQFDVTNVWTVLGPVAAALTIFAIMLTDFFDTMGTVTGVASEAGLANEDGSVPGVGRVLFVDSIAAIAGGVGGVSSNTTFIESAAGVAEGGRTGFASIVTGVLFLLAIFLSPLASIIPNAATAPALVLVGYLMFTQVKDIDVGNVEDGIPAMLTMILMPLTYDITIGIGAGFITWVVIKLARGKLAEIHPLMWVISAMFVVYFLQAWINTLIATPASLTGARPSKPRPRGRGFAVIGYHRSDVRTDGAASRTTRDQRPAPRGAVGVDRCVRARGVAARDRRPVRRRPFHGAPDVQGHPGVSLDARHQRGDRGRRGLVQRRHRP